MTVQAFRFRAIWEMTRNRENNDALIPAFGIAEDDLATEKLHLLHLLGKG